MPSKLLLADDSVTIQRVIELTFADEDIRVIAVGDGQRAIEEIERERPDIVLADIGMPERDGYEVAAFVKRHASLSHTPVVLLAGAFEPVDEARARDIGCDGVLVKPFEPQVVINRVRALLTGGSAESPWLSPPAARPSAPSTSAGGAAAPDSVRPVVPQARRSLSAEPSDLLPSGEDTPPSPGTDDAIEDYFDELDAEFSKLPDRARTGLGTGAQARSRESSARREREPPAPAAAPAAPPLASEEWGAMELSERAPGRDPSGASEPPAELFAPEPVVAQPAPQSKAQPKPAPDRLPHAAPPAEAEPVRSVSPPVRRAVHPPAPPKTKPRPQVSRPPPSGSPVLAEAFTALLAAEQGGAPAPVDRTSVAERLITDELIEAVTRRILERLSDQVVRSTVGDIVSEVAERLVREEIEHIKKTAE